MQRLINYCTVCCRSSDFFDDTQYFSRSVCLAPRWCASIRRKSP